jgi:hypothetical protein
MRLRSCEPQSNVRLAHPLPPHDHSLFQRSVDVARLLLPLMLEHIRGRLNEDRPHHIGLAPGEAREMLEMEARQCLKIQRACGQLRSPAEEDDALVDALFSDKYFGQQPLSLDVRPTTMRDRIVPSLVQSFYELGEPIFINYEIEGQRIALHDLRSLFTPETWLSLLDDADAKGVVDEFIRERPALKLDAANVLEVLYTHEALQTSSAAPLHSNSTGSNSGLGSEDAALDADADADADGNDILGAGAGVGAGPILPAAVLAGGLTLPELTKMGYAPRKLPKAARIPWLTAGEMTWLCQAAYDALDDATPETTFLVFGNTPYLVGKVLAQAAAHRGMPPPDIVFMPFSGAPNHRREYKGIDWRSATSEARIAFLHRVMECYGMTPERLRGRNLKLIDLVGSGGGPFFFLLELIRMNGDVPPCDMEVLCVNEMPIRFMQGWLSNVRLVGPDVSLQHLQPDRRGIISHPCQEAPIMQLPFRSLGVPGPLLQKLDKTMACQRFQPFFYALYWQDCYAANLAQGPSLMAKAAVRDIQRHCQEWLRTLPKAAGPRQRPGSLRT